MSSSVQESIVGRVLDGRYRVLSRIADGGMASVYLAVDERLDREVALKVMRPDLAQDETFVSRFRREARSAARLSHPNVVGVFDQGEDGGDMFLAMEYVPGRTLREVLLEEGPLTPRAALDLFDPMLQALDAAHTAGLIHRDVKPENVILRDDGTVKVADFGLARAVTASTTTNQSGVLLGTVAYLSPEQVERGIADARSDVYAAGLILFEMLTGQKAVTGDTPIHVAYQHVHGSVPMPSDRVPTVPQELDQLVALATARDPDQRPASAGDYLAEVRRSRSALSTLELDLRPAPSLVAEPATTVQVARTAAIPVADQTAPPARPAAGDPGGPGAGGPLQTRRRRRVWLWLLVLLAVAGAVGGLWYATQGPGAMTRVPVVAGLDRAAAEQALADAGLRSQVVEAFDETARKGSVMVSDPGGGQEVRKLTPVRLTVSLGPERYAAPSLVGAKREDVATMLAGAKLTLGTVTEAFDETAPAGRVIAQDPAPGTALKRDTPVAVTVSKGRTPVTVPDVTGKPADQARKTLTDAGLKVVEGPQVNSDTVAAGSVVSQDPPSGTLFRGDPVTIVVSKGPVMVQVPNVTLKGVAEAKAALTGAGFQVKVTSLYGGLLGVVRFQSPNGGTMAPKGSVVTIQVV